MKKLAMYINGQFEQEHTGKWQDVINPATEEVIAQLPHSSPSDIDRAVNICIKSPMAFASVPMN